jgi:hypothetical protein
MWDAIFPGCAEAEGMAASDGEDWRREEERRAREKGV